MLKLAPLAAPSSSGRTALPVITEPVRQLDARLWAILTRPGPLTDDEWAFVEDRERIQLAADVNGTT